MQSAAIYIRVSSQEQADEGYSIQAQTERLKAYCLARDWFVYDVYIDPGFSGSNLDRPGIRRLIQDVKSRRFDAVVVYKLDRLSRSQKDTLMVIEDVFLKHDVAFVSINENFDTSTAFGRAMIGILSVFAQLEREQIKERTLMGRFERAKDGYFHGGGFDPIGYDYVDGELVVNENEAAQVRKVFELFLDGWSIARIQRFMKDHYTNKYGSWGHTSAVHSALTQPIVIGKVKYCGELFDGRHQPIVDLETFNKANARYEAIRWNKKGTKEIKRPFMSNYLLAGLVYCKRCGARYYVKGNYSGHGSRKVYHPYYTCYSRGKTARQYVKDPDCKNRSYFYKDLDDIVIGELRKLRFNPERIRELQRETIDVKSPSELSNEALRARVAEIDKQITRLIDLYQVGSLSPAVVTKRINDLTSTRDQLSASIVEVVPVVKMSFSETVKTLDRLDEVLNDEDPMKRKTLVGSLIDRIEIDGDDVFIHWSFS